MVFTVITSAAGKPALTLNMQTTVYEKELQ